MDRRALAEALLSGDDAERTQLLAEHAALANVELAHVLKQLHDEARASDPARAADAAAALQVLAQTNPNLEIQATASWAAGMTALLVRGQPDEALGLLDAAEAGFQQLGQHTTAANVQVSKVYALAILGQYEAAIATGMQARDMLLADGDLLSTGKIEQNLGNIHWRRDNYAAAEQLYRSAWSRYMALGDQQRLAGVETNLATVHVAQYNFEAATKLYEQALERATATGSTVTQAAIEGNLGWMALFQGNYDRALDMLEQSRRHYSALNMPHESAVAELELADAFLELNLAREAAEIYARVAELFAALGMRAEHARALAHHARARLLNRQYEEAVTLISQARALYEAEENTVGAALVALTEAQALYGQGDYHAAAQAAAQAEQTFMEAGAVGRGLLARWLRGECARQVGSDDAATALLTSALEAAEQQPLPQLAQLCSTALGLIAARAGDTARGRQLLEHAIELIELLRTPLPGEEFRVAFVADKLAPYAALTELILRETTPEAIAAAFATVEQARARTLLDVVAGNVRPHMPPADSFEAETAAKIQQLSEELSWLYSTINRTFESDSGGMAEIERLQTDARTREAAVLQLSRQLQQHGSAAGSHTRMVSLAELQRDLDAETVVVEYVWLEGELSAFVISDADVSVYQRLASEAHVWRLLEQLHFQIDALRYGAMRTSMHVAQLERRTRNHLARLYDMLLRPFEHVLGQRHLIVIPQGVLHYIPFHALDSGRGYVIERQAVSYAPSASMLHYCRERRPSRFEHAVLLGVGDERMPLVRNEIAALEALFPEAVTLADGAATRAALREHAPHADVLHLASHAQFRPDNPLFSALHLADGWVTVRDASNLRLRQSMVTLSACETGVSSIAPGDELLGMVRGFLSAGATGLLISLWPVDDSTTANHMVDFYTRLRAGDTPADALRYAQLQVRATHPHPFYWAPFVYIGW